ncbi:hypothetical protein SAMN05421819_0410 [Bryocella elongata]|uniref:Zinc-finger n=1 Tax=Bryocella elongata TaxID=863522 RepID=A0A1H5SZ77_9BACT|nr:hypothetical protein [Bryocella elongata]SEF55774.1 hypothetical protein SAMN05421819_0410 [Bryocella elongata]
MRGTCSRADEVRKLVIGGQWPAAAGDELRGHVSVCKGCSLTASITLAMRGARERDLESVKLEPAGLIWWRAQLRKRREAMEQVSRPMLKVQTVSVGTSLLVAVVLLAWLGLHGASSVGWGGWKAAAASPFAGLASLGGATVWLGVVVLAALGAAAVYFLVEREG